MAMADMLNEVVVEAVTRFVNDYALQQSGIDVETEVTPTSQYAGW